MSKEYIGREEVILAVRHAWAKGLEPTQYIEQIPAADVTPVVHGRWIEDHDYLKCPECSVMVKWDFTFFDIGDWNYCPNCGAYMMGKNNGKCE